MIYRNVAKSDVFKFQQNLPIAKIDTVTDIVDVQGVQMAVDK